VNRSQLQDMVSISASVGANELHVEHPPRTRVSFVGEGTVTTVRRNLPPTGTEKGGTYRDVEVTVEINARPSCPSAPSERSARSAPRDRGTR
jgi:hypothetical protein